MDATEHNNPRSWRRPSSRQNPLPSSHPIAKRRPYGVELDDDDDEDDELDDLDNGEQDDDEEDEEFELSRRKNPSHMFNFRNGRRGFAGGGDDDNDEDYDPNPSSKKRKVKTSAPELSSKSLIRTDLGSFMLLEVWGNRFLELGRQTVRSEDWVEIAEEVSKQLRMRCSELDCKNQLHLLKKKYRKIRMDPSSSGGSRWIHFKKMEMLMGGSRDGEEEEGGLACGVDSGEYCFTDMQVYMDKSNAFDEMRDSPGESESDMDDEDEEEEAAVGMLVDEDDDLPPRRNVEGGEGMRVLADSIERFGELYEKMESSKRQQMMELRKMRSEFQRELDLQKKEIVERAQAEIARIQAGGGRDDDSFGFYFI